MNTNSKKGPDRRAVITHRDAPLLHFLWKWKMTTTSAIAAKFYPNLALWTAYKRLWVLEKAGYIRARCDETQSYCLWALNKRGFAFVKARMPKMREEGYLSEYLVHDALVSAVHLGDGLIEDSSGLEFFSEQELRRLHPNDFPEWVPKNMFHRSDGFWRLMNESGQQVIALEVELTSKCDDDYEMVGRFYGGETKVAMVLWIVSGARFAEKIHRLTSRVSRGQTKHAFVELDAIYSKGWQASISFGQKSGKTIAEVLGKCLPSSSQVHGTHLMLDGRKSPQNTKFCGLLGGPR
ncbi:MAG: hypothetical protein HYZ71_06835 [Deltaproteobacteria bacterium]|nr:hypothetical protein [Deltaproteobacteria bacterium]